MILLRKTSRNSAYERMLSLRESRIYDMIYFDNSATTPLCREAYDAMLSVMGETFGNPSSRHAAGVSAHAVVKAARMQVLSALGVRNGKDENLIFTASGTEADNLAIRGSALAKKALAGGKIITSDSEHPAVLRTVESLEKEGFRAAYIPTRGGVFDMDAFQREMTPDTFLVSVMLVNNETGQVNDIRKIADAARAVNPGVLIHTDAVQGFLKLPFTPESLSADLITVSSHKIHGPKGMGALYVSQNSVKRRSLSPVIFGGGQEGGFRSGTENVIGIAGFGAAADIGKKNLSADLEKMEALRSAILSGLSADGVLSSVQPTIPGSEAHAPHIVSIRLPGIKSETMLNYLSGRGICVSSGSACSAQSGRISSTLLNFGLSEKEADSTLRVSLSARNTEEEVSEFLSALRDGVSTLVRMKR